MGILGDFIYAKTSSLSSTPRGILFSTATADLEESIGTFLLEYRPFEVKWGFIDLLAGARGLCDYAQLASAGKPSSGPRHHRYVSWVDTIIGLKGRIRISHWFSSMPTATWEDSERDRNSAGRHFWVQVSKFPDSVPSSPAIAHLDTTFGRTTPPSISSRTVPTQALR